MNMDKEENNYFRKKDALLEAMFAFQLAAQATGRDAKAAVLNVVDEIFYKETP